MTAPNAGLRAATVQFEPRPLDIEYNLGRVNDLSASAARQSAAFVVFPEMCLVGYWHLRRRSAEELRQIGEPAHGELTSRVTGIAKRYGVGVGVGFLERDGQRLYNSYAVCLPDGAVHVHRKLHAFEHPAISSGDTFTVFDTPWGVRMGVLICWDNNLVENVRATALLGADVLLAPHQTGGTDSRSPHGMKRIPMPVWDARDVDPGAVRDAFAGPNGRQWLLRWLPSRAHDNGMFVVFSNGVGRDDDEVRTGNAMIIDPYGRIIAESEAVDDALVVADIDLSLLPLATGRRWIRGRRPELYDLLTSRRGDELDPRAARFSTDPIRADR